MKALLNDLYHHRRLERLEAKDALLEVASGQVDPAHIASFLTVFNMRSITLDELAGFRDAMLELCVPIDLSEYMPMDLCGTGGDGKDTFNISTTASFVVATAGVKVAKHGNYGVSSISGSSNMIEYFGYTFTNDINHLKEKIESTNICFLHAPLFHPAMKHVAPIRKAMGVKTFFNILGPLTNPALVKKQITGTYNLETARLYHYLLQRESIQYTIVHALDGYDEISLTGDTKLWSRGAERVVSPEDMGFKKVLASEIRGGSTVAESANIFKNILSGKGTESQNAVVSANAAAAIRLAKNISPAEALIEAKEIIASGKGWDTFTSFIK